VGRTVGVCCRRGRVGFASRRGRGLRGEMGSSRTHDDPREKTVLNSGDSLGPRNVELAACSCDGLPERLSAVWLPGIGAPDALYVPNSRAGKRLTGRPRRDGA